MLMKIWAYCNLAARLTASGIRSLLRMRGGLYKFWRNYREDRLFALTAGERESYPKFSGCTGCGLCDAVCEKLDKASLARFPGPSAIALSYSRSLPDLWAASESVEHLTECRECRKCEAICPTEVPVVDIIEFIKRQAGTEQDEG